jgi:hypothetical protein
MEVLYQLSYLGEEDNSSGVARQAGLCKVSAGRPRDESQAP